MYPAIPVDDQVVEEGERSENLFPYLCGSRGVLVAVVVKSCEWRTGEQLDEVGQEGCGYGVACANCEVPTGFAICDDLVLDRVNVGRNGVAKEWQALIVPGDDVVEARGVEFWLHRF